jgi:hypothetical protein
MFGAPGPADAASVRTAVVWMMAIIVVTHALAWFRERGRFDWSRPLFVRAMILTACAAGILVFARDNADTFIYFQF